MSVAYKYNCLSKLVPAEMPQKLKKSTGIIEGLGNLDQYVGVGVPSAMFLAS